MKSVLGIVFIGLVLLHNTDCYQEDLTEDVIEVVFDINLPKNDDGYFILELDRSKNQTIHTLSGEVFPPIEYKRFEWSSNLEFKVGPYYASTTNIRSYTNKEGIFRNTIGPTLDMLGDTLLLKVRWDSKMLKDDVYSYNPSSYKLFAIVLK